MPCFPHPRGLAAIVLALALVPVLAAQAPEPREAAAVLIHLDAAGQAVVRSVDVTTLRTPAPIAGLLVWADAGSQERWQLISRGWTLPAEESSAPDTAVALAGTRSAGGGGGAEGAAGLTVQLDQLRGSLATRDTGACFTPPAGGLVLSRRPTFRRLPLKGKYPAAVATVTPLASKGPALRFRFPDGQAAVAFADIPGLPPALAAGLVPGTKYTLALETAPTPTVFTVETAGAAARVRRPLDELAGVLGNRADPLYLTFALEHLLARTDDKKIPLYLADALDVLESVPEASLFPYLREQRQLLLTWLKMPRTQLPDARTPRVQAPGADTGLPDIDRARAQVAATRWDDAKQTLEDVLAGKGRSTDRRARGLASVYLGVVFAELGTGLEDDALRSFRQGIALLQDGLPADQFRAHNNFADFLLQQAQDGLYNHALQLAAGVERPFLTALRNWLAAREHYETALALAEKLGQAQDRAAVEVNVARLYTLLADVVRTLDRERRFADAERAAARQADTFAARAAKTPEPLVRALATEVRAHLAYRAGDLSASRAHAVQTRAALLAVGNLAGVENVERLLGLTAPSRGEARKHFQVASLINESLRERLPSDGVGRTQAAFFARKAWVNERIVELLLHEKRYAEALRSAELARARALQDLLLADHGKADTAADDTSRPAADFLAGWPSQVAAVEYFLGTQHAWVFVVSIDGKVTAHPLRTATGDPVETPRLVERVHRFLLGIEGQATRMFNRVMAGQGFDHGWQDDLHTLCNELLPPPALAELRRARTVVIVPQHILHYFPFAALVTKKDTDRGPQAMIKPTHLLDEKFTLVYAPSLTTWNMLRHRPAAAAAVVNAVGLVQAPGADPLPGVDEDLKNLRTVFGKRLRTLHEGDGATEANAKRLLVQPGMLFFATHGLNDADRPLDSFLILLPDTAVKEEADPKYANDGRLTAREIFDKKVNADLLVMSACYSGLGDRSPLPGDDLFGLQRAFLQSGARTVVSGLWDVYDGTAPQLMKGFFERLADGKAAPEALAGSQRAFVNRLRASSGVEPWLHPYFWAVYTAAGDHRTVMSK